MSAQKKVDLWSLSDLRTPWCIFVVATLRIADHIAAGKERNQCPRRGGRLRCGCVAPGTFPSGERWRFPETAPGRFALNEAAQELLDPAQLLGLDLTGIGGRMAYAWGTLLDYVHTGAPAYHKVFGKPFFEDLDAHPKVAASFDALIGPMGHGKPNPHFEITGGWALMHTVADVGGGTGALLAGILQLRTHLHGILIDRSASGSPFCGDF